MERTPGEQKAHQVGLQCADEINAHLTIILSAIQALQQSQRSWDPDQRQLFNDIGTASLRIANDAGQLMIFSQDNGATASAISIEQLIDRVPF